MSACSCIHKHVRTYVCWVHTEIERRMQVCMLGVSRLPKLIFFETIEPNNRPNVNEPPHLQIVPSFRCVSDSRARPEATFSLLY